MDFSRAHRLARRFAPLGRAAFLLAVSVAAGRAGAACGAPDGGVRVAGVDDRLDLVLADGRTVRLAGVALPDYARSPDLAEEARRFLADRFVDRDAELERLAGGTDRWGRVLADLAISGPPGAGGSAAAAVLAAGFGRVAPAFEARACAAERLRAEGEARGAGLGVWSDPGSAVIAAADVDALRRSGSRLVVIEGTVRRVGFGRSRLYLDLAPKGGPTIVVPRKLEGAFARAGVSVEAAAGRTIRVRGALDNRLGPRLEVSEPAMIEFLGGSGAPGAIKPRP
ncbi:endonuclease YncB(thermonuclease family) [Roseiarcus fermentans]|uniref:Endonuclease YncB(Thermonuclease family) n=1 Tax=Roseiarcus fermentans TaxID=1473586 RepID=A0A366EP34_9HYPH|nr:thermonuclease family protein [Roseiarcus fermentans]RBP04151.1 endonuclease YncB(thermonuclease family) [Roseiarcus fermentans]